MPLGGSCSHHAAVVLPRHVAAFRVFGDRHFPGCTASVAAGLLHVSDPVWYSERICTLKAARAMIYEYIESSNCDQIGCATCRRKNKTKTSHRLGSEGGEEVDEVRYHINQPINQSINQSINDKILVPYPYDCGASHGTVTVCFEGAKKKILLSSYQTRRDKGKNC